MKYSQTNVMDVRKMCLYCNSVRYGASHGVFVREMRRVRDFCVNTRYSVYLCVYMCAMYVYVLIYMATDGYNGDIYCDIV